MTEPVFFKRTRELTIGEIAELTGAEPQPGSDLDRRIDNIAPLDSAGPSELSFLDNARYVRHAASSRAGACLLAPRFEKSVNKDLIVLRVREPFRAFVMVVRTLYPDALRPSSLFAAGAAAGAFVHPTARLEAGVTIDPVAVIGADVEIGAGSVVGAGAVIGSGVRIGRGCSIGSRATVTHALIGDRVIIHPGCSIGQDGFGYVMGASGHLKVPQIGRVIIQDDVEIGANTTIDRGAIRDTVIGEGTKIDNLIQVGHNVTIGRHCVIVGQSGIAGSATLEDFVVMGARAGVANHVRVGEGAQIAGLAGVKDDVPPGQRWGGIPAKPVQLWFRELAMLQSLAKAREKEKAGQIDSERSH